MNYFANGLRLAVILILALLLPACAEDDAPASTADGGADSVISWTGRDLVSGSAVEFPAVLAQKPAVMIFWATWCPYCKAFMPYTEAILEDYAEHGVQVVALNAKERGRGDPRAYVQSLGFPIVSVANADAIAVQYGVEYLPGLMVVNGQGAIVYQRGWTELPAGRKVAQQWDLEVRAALDLALNL